MATYIDKESKNRHRIQDKVILSIEKKSSKFCGLCAAACDYLGERMASLFGITSAKYQYAIDEHNRIRKEVGHRGTQRDTVTLISVI